MLNTLRDPALKRRLIGCLLLALMLAQGLALAHAIAHGTRLAVTGQNATATLADSDAVWGHAAGSASCHLVDQMLLGNATGFDLPPLPLLPRVAAPPDCLPPAAVARLALRVYEARGPPRA